MSARCENGQTDDAKSKRQQEPQPPSAPAEGQQGGPSIGSIGNIGGRYNPTILGSNQVTFNINVPPERPDAGEDSQTPKSGNPPAGVPLPNATRHRRVRPDRYSRLRNSYQGAGNKLRQILAKWYKTTGSFVQLTPGVDDDQVHITGIYTKLQVRTREGLTVVANRGQEGANIINSTEYDKIFRAETKSGDLIKRLLFFGTGGVGKSTIFDKIAYDWAEGTSEVLNGFKLVIALKMCALSQQSDLVPAIYDQLLGEDSGVSRDALEAVLQEHSNEILILLDGFDELKTRVLDEARFGSVLKALNRMRYRECFIAVTTRISHLERLMAKSLVQNPCTHVEVLGFTNEDVRDYVRKFHSKEPDVAEALIHAIDGSHTLRDLASIPMLLLLMCLLWRENAKLPETMSRLFSEALVYIFIRKKDVSRKDVLNTLIAIGKPALRGLIDADLKLAFQEDEFETNALDLALKAGIVTKHRVIKNLKSHNTIQFTHKAILEYCAAQYWQSVHLSTQAAWKRFLYYVLYIFNVLGDFHHSLACLSSSIESVVLNEFLLRFCCGDNEICMADIVKQLDFSFSRDRNQPKYQSSVIQAIIRNCFLESQSSNVPQCLTNDSSLPTSIDVSNNNDFRSLMYLLEVICRSDNRTAQLAHVEAIFVSEVFPVSGLAVALGFMKNLRYLRLSECPLVDGDLEKILTSLKCNEILTHLHIDGNNTSGGAAVEWAPHLIHLTNLKTLELTQCCLRCRDIDDLASCVGEMPNLSELTLSGNPELGRSGALWCKHLPCLRHVQTLNLSLCLLQCTDVEQIALSVADMPSLTSIVLAGNRALGGTADVWSQHLPSMKHVERLDLSNCSLEWADIQHIAPCVSNMASLADLILTDNPALGEHASKWSCYVLRVDGTHTLNLSNRSLNCEDVEFLTMFLSHMPRVTRLVLSGNTTLGGSADTWSLFISSLAHVEVLDLSDCSLQWSDLQPLAASVGHMPRLTDLNLAANAALGGLGELWSHHLLQMRNVQALNLDDCSLRGKDVEHIASSVGDMPKLTGMSLARNTALGNTGWPPKMKSMKHLQSLNLSSCSLRWEDVQHIAACASDMPALYDLNLTDNSALGGLTQVWSSYLLRVKAQHTLNLSNFGLKCEEFKTVAKFLREMPGLTELVLTGNLALGGLAGVWSQDLAEMTNIQSLNLSNCSLQGGDIEHIASCAADLPRLTSLILGGNPALGGLAVSGMPRLASLILSDNTALGGRAAKWSRFLLRIKHTHTLDLVGACLQCEDVNTIGMVLTDMPRVIPLIVSGNTSLGGSAALWSLFLPRLTHIESLDLSNCSLQWMDLKFLATYICIMPRLGSLNLSGNAELGTGGSAVCWTRFLPQMVHVRTLDLSGFSPHWTDMEHIASAVGDMPRLIELTMADNASLGGYAEFWAGGLIEMVGIHTLDLSRSSLQWEDIEHIALSVHDMPRLTALILADNSELGGSAVWWAPFLRQMTHLRKLDLTRCALQKKDVTHVASSLGDMPRLTDLILTANTTLGGSAVVWSRYLPHMDHVRALNLSNCSLQCTDVEYIASSVGNMPRLTELVLADNTALGGAADVWSQNLPRMRHLETLNVGSCSLQCADVEHIASSAGDMPRLTDLVLAGNPALGGSAELWCPQLLRMHHVRTLNLSSCSLQWTDYQDIAQGVSDMPAVNDLILAENLSLHNDIAWKWHCYFLQAKHQHTLNLTNCSLRCKDVEAVASFVEDMPTVTALILSRNASLGGWANRWACRLARLQHVVTLSLSQCLLQWTDVEHVVAALGDMPSLRRVALAGNASLGGSAVLWSRHLPLMTEVRTLDLSDCLLQFNDVEHICSAVSNMPRLTHLRLAGNAALGGSAELWAQFLPLMANVRRLDLGSCCMQYADVGHIASSLRKMPVLTDLIVSGNTSLGGSALLWSTGLSRMSHVKTLSLGSCSIEGKDVLHIASSAADMSRLVHLVLADNTALGGTAGVWSRHLQLLLHVGTLDLSNCSLLLTDVKPIACSVSAAVSSLVLAGNSALGASAEYWAPDIRRMQHARTLSLSNCSLQPADVQHIAACVRDMPRLTSLVLVGNRALGGTAQVWARYLPEMQGLRALDLSDCSLQIADVGHIASALDDMPSLTDLDLAGNTALGDLSELSTRYPSLVNYAASQQGLWNPGT